MILAIIERIENIKEETPFNHQSIKDVANGFNVSAKAEDGTIEAIEKDNIVGVQWHPERVNDLLFFRHFINKFF